MDGIKVTCQCGRVLTAPASHAGKNARCPACGASFIIPLPDQPAPTPPAEPPPSQPETPASTPDSPSHFPAKVLAIFGGAVLLLTGIVIGIVLLVSGGGPPVGPPKLKITETSLGNIQGMVPKSPTLSPDGKHFAYVGQHGWKRLVVVDGVEGKEYDDIDVFKEYDDMDVFNFFNRLGKRAGLTFSPDSSRLAYRAKRGDKWLVVVDRVEGKEYDSIREFPIFSPDSKRVTYVAERDGKMVVVVDGVEVKEYDLITYSTLFFSSDLKRVAQVVRVVLVLKRWSLLTGLRSRNMATGVSMVSPLVQTRSTSPMLQTSALSLTVSRESNTITSKVLSSVPTRSASRMPQRVGINSWSWLTGSRARHTATSQAALLSKASSSVPIRSASRMPQSVRINGWSWLTALRARNIEASAPSSSALTRNELRTALSVTTNGYSLLTESKARSMTSLLAKRKASTPCPVSCPFSPSTRRTNFMPWRYATAKSSSSKSKSRIRAEWRPPYGGRET